MSLTIDQLAPVATHNRFWPLSDQLNVKPQLVVIHGSENEEKLSKNKNPKHSIHQHAGHTETSDGDNVHSDTVGNQSQHISKNAPASHVVDSRRSGNTVVLQDKYDLALKFKAKHRDKLEKAKNSTSFQQWDNQTVGKFGYIPISDQITAAYDKPKYSQDDLLRIHEKVKTTGKSNFLDAQIRIPSQLNVTNWEKNLKNYWDKQLLQLICYGFPLSFDSSTYLLASEVNHSSAREFPEDIKKYLQEERDFNAILGPFKEPPVPDLHVSPFLTREMPGATNRRVIVDLSYPHGASVNSGVDPDMYLGSEFLLTLPSIDYITNKVLELGKDSLIYKIDISRAFRHIKIDPRDYNLLGLKFDSYYIDTCLPFGFRHGSAIFQRVSDAIRYMMLHKGYHVTNYIDDIIGQATLSQAEAAFDTLYDLLGELGLDISEKKLVRPSTKASCLGVVINTQDFTVSVPEDKLDQIRDYCVSWQNRTRCTKRDLQSLLGKLLYVTKCVRSSRPFLNRMLELLRKADKQVKIGLTDEFKRDLHWFVQFLPRFNGVAFFSHDKLHSHIELDASLQGLGAVCDNEVYSIPIDLGFQDLGIVHLEMLNILVALRVWGHRWQGKRIIIHCDNQAVVIILNSGKTKDTTLAAITRNIAMLTAINDINLNTIHIPGKLNRLMHFQDYLQIPNLLFSLIN